MQILIYNWILRRIKRTDLKYLNLLKRYNIFKNRYTFFWVILYSSLTLSQKNKRPYVLYYATWIKVYPIVSSIWKTMSQTVCYLYSFRFKLRIEAAIVILKYDTHQSLVELRSFTLTPKLYYLYCIERNSLVYLGLWE